MNNVLIFLFLYPTKNKTLPEDHKMYKLITIMLENQLNIENIKSLIFNIIAHYQQNYFKKINKCNINCEYNLSYFLINYKENEASNQESNNNRIIPYLYLDNK